MNKYGLPREIPDAIRREVRRRCKFGCVICRSGVFDYEHINPAYAGAKVHEAENICCLCSSCHGKVNRRHYSKAFVRGKYAECQRARSDEVRAPYDHLDFHDGKAELKIGGILYDPGVNCILRYHGAEIISVSPSNGEVPGGMNATFFDQEGNRTLKIEENRWVGEIGAWDTETVGPRIMVRSRRSNYSLRLRLDPPGRIVVERLDMRLKDAHILVSERTHALGRIADDNSIYWFHANMVSMGAPLPEASAIEYLTPYEIEWRDQNWSGRGQRLATEDNQAVMQSGLGVTWKPIGIIVGANCLKFRIGTWASGGPRPLERMRKLVFQGSQSVPEFIATGKIGKGVRP